MSIKDDHPQHTAEKKKPKQHNKQTNKNLKMPKLVYSPTGKMDVNYLVKPCLYFFSEPHFLSSNGQCCLCFFSLYSFFFSNEVS